jgi:hypothetical protein
MNTAGVAWVHDLGSNVQLVSPVCSDFHPGISENDPVVACDCNENGVRDDCDIDSGHSSDDNNNGVPDECDPPVLIHANGLLGETRPFSGYVDPLRESDNGVDVNQGIDRLTMVFSQPVFAPGGGPLMPVDFVVSETGDDTAPTPMAVDAVGNPLIEVTLSRIITPEEWTTVQAVVENEFGVPIVNLDDLGPGADEPDRVDIAFLPADLDQNGTVTPFDLLRYREIINGAFDPPAGTDEDFVDTDRNETITPFDLLSFRQLINGVSPATQSWDGESLNNPRP